MQALPARPCRRRATRRPHVPAPTGRPDRPAPSPALRDLEHAIARRRRTVADPAGAAVGGSPRLDGAHRSRRRTGRYRPPPAIRVPRHASSDPAGWARHAWPWRPQRRDRSGRDITIVNLAGVTDVSALADGSPPPSACAATSATRSSRRAPFWPHGHGWWCSTTANTYSARCADSSPLYRACPDLTVVATSRERLGLPFEQVCRVAPLPLPAPDQRDDLEAVPSVAVFLDRARRVRPTSGLATTKSASSPAWCDASTASLLPSSSPPAGCRRSASPTSAPVWTGPLTSSAAPPRSETSATALCEWPSSGRTTSFRRRTTSLSCSGRVPGRLRSGCRRRGRPRCPPAVDPTSAVAHLVDASMLVATSGSSPLSNARDAPGLWPRPARRTR